MGKRGETQLYYQAILSPKGALCYLGVRKSLSIIKGDQFLKIKILLILISKQA